MIEHDEIIERGMIICLNCEILAGPRVLVRGLLIRGVQHLAECVPICEHTKATLQLCKSERSAQPSFESDCTFGTFKSSVNLGARTLL